MKKKILLLFVAILAVATMSAQETKKAIYVIDGKQIENFDGTQLVGKTIVNYSIDHAHNLHSIITSELTGRKEVKSVKVLSASREVKSCDADNTGVSADIFHVKADEIAFVLDGKIVSYTEIKPLSSSNIESVTVIKNAQDKNFQKFSKEYMKIYKTVPKRIILITSKK
ncbi:MAG: hypothetical protein IJQ05_02090 [Bacteroidaceae bacterium]|nr:hypothetical protein [Bacteroidaceae bacterium]